MVSRVDDLWGTLSRKVLSSVLVDDGAVFPVVEIVRNNTRWFAPKERPIWLGILQCLETNTPPTVEAVSVRVNGGTDAGYIQHIATLFNDDDNRHLLYNTEQLRDLGILANLRGIGQELSKIDSVDDLAQAVDKASTEIAGLYAEKNNRRQDAEALDAAAWQQVERFSELTIPTGLGWFDKLTGGLWPGMNYWIVAAYKSGKTTLMRNMILAAAQAGHPISAYCAEGTRELFTIGCQVMLATKLLYDQYGFEQRERLRLSTLFVMQNGKKKDSPVFTADEWHAIQQARTIWRGLPIRVYDTLDGIRDLVTLQYDIKRDKMKYGTVAAYLDFSQLFGKGKTIFDRQSANSQRFQEIAVAESVALTVLAQRNEETIKRRDSKDYSPGVKGGGDAPAAADFLIIPQMDLERKEVLKQELTHSRWTATGRGAHLVNPSSGLILKQLVG